MQVAMHHGVSCGLHIGQNNISLGPAGEILFWPMCNPQDTP